MFFKVLANISQNSEVPPSGRPFSYEEYSPAPGGQRAAELSPPERQRTQPFYTTRYVSGAPFISFGNTAQPQQTTISGQRAAELSPPERQRTQPFYTTRRVSGAPFFSFRNTAQPQQTADKLSHCPTSTLAHYLTSPPAHFFLAREGFLVSAIQAVKSSGVTWSSLSAQGFHFSDFFRLWTMSSVFLPVCCSNRYARRIQ